MQTSLLLTALLMGIVGGPHCLAMCGAACAGIGQLRIRDGFNPTQVRRLELNNVMMFHIGRVVGYSAMGVLASASVQTLGWLTIQSSAFRPLWSMLHIAAIGLGLMLLIQAKQPAWLDLGARKMWGRFKSGQLAQHSFTPIFLGVTWALMPCGLLYSALMVAALTGQMFYGASIMAVFALGTSISLLLGPWLWFRLKQFTGQGQWGIRLAGFTLAATSAWGLWLGLMHNTAPWCVV